MIKPNRKPIQKEHLNQKQDYSKKACTESKTSGRSMLTGSKTIGTCLQSGSPEVEKHLYFIFSTATLKPLKIN
jgi:hypothetical protein